MKKCSVCKQSILFGGKKVGGLLFCSDKCFDALAAETLKNNVSEEMIDKEVMAIHNGRCPVCNGPGPVDFYEFHRIISFIAISSWSSESMISCASCALKQQKKSLLSSLLLGWWGVPFGIIMTPVQIVRNLIEIDNTPIENGPSKDLKNQVRLDIGRRAVEEKARSHSESARLWTGS